MLSIEQWPYMKYCVFVSMCMLGLQVQLKYAHQMSFIGYLNPSDWKFDWTNWCVQFHMIVWLDACEWLIKQLVLEHSVWRYLISWDLKYSFYTYTLMCNHFWFSFDKLWPISSWIWFKWVRNNLLVQVCTYMKMIPTCALCTTLTERSYAAAGWKGSWLGSERHSWRHCLWWMKEDTIEICPILNIARPLCKKYCVFRKFNP